MRIGQIYLLDNPLLRRPRTRDDVEPWLLGAAVGGFPGSDCGTRTTMKTDADQLPSRLRVRWY